MSSTVYRERLWVSPWVSLLLGGLIGMLFTIGAIQLFQGIYVGSRPAPTPMLFGLGVFLALLYVIFSRLEIYIDTSRVRVSFGFIRKVIPLGEIEYCEPIRSSFIYGGVGIRYSIFDGSVAFTTSFGNAVRVRRKNGRPFVFSTNRSQEVSKLINGLIPPVA